MPYTISRVLLVELSRICEYARSTLFPIRETSDLNENSGLNAKTRAAWARAGHTHVQ